MEYLLILNTFRIPRSSLDIQDGIYEKTLTPVMNTNVFLTDRCELSSLGLVAVNLLFCTIKKQCN